MGFGMNNHRGFTLIEVIVVLSILFILLGFGVSMMGAKMQHYRLKNALDSSRRGSPMKKMMKDKNIRILKKEYGTKKRKRREG